MGRLFKEKMEYLAANFRTREGLFEFLLGSLIWGFILVKYTPEIFAKILGFIPIQGFFQEYVGYLIFGLIMLPLEIIITYLLTKLYWSLFKKNKQII